MTYATIFRCFSDFTYVKIIKDDFLTRQREHRRRAQCRTPQDFSITLKKIEKVLTKDYLEKTDVFTYTKRYKYAAAVHYPSLPFGTFVRSNFEGK